MNGFSLGRAARRAVGIGILVVAGACHPLTYIEPITSFSGVDFSPYTKQGFMFTPEKYAGPYESVGVIYVTMYPEGHRVRNEKTGLAQWQFQDLRIDDVLAQAYNRARAMGADAIINFDVKSVTRTVETQLVPGIQVSGFAIHRLPAR